MVKLFIYVFLEINLTYFLCLEVFISNFSPTNHSNPLKKKHVILNADDFAANDFIDNGIIKGIAAGKVTSISAFVTHPDSEQRIKNLLSKFPNFPVGLHFSITSGSPVDHKDSLLTTREAGKLVFQHIEDYDYSPARKKGKLMAEELERQLYELKSILGSYDKIDHVTIHHSLTSFELKYYKPVVDVLAKYDLPTRSLNSWSSSFDMDDDTDNNIFELAPVLRRGFKLRIFNIDMLATWKKERYAKKRKLKYPDWLCDVIYGQPSIEQFEFVVDHFKHEEEGRKEYSIEIMLHLGDRSNISDDVYRQCVNTHGINVGYYELRQKELDVLMSYDLDEHLRQYDVVKSSFRDLHYI